MDFTYLIILVAVLIISPYVLAIASAQKKETKGLLKVVYIFVILIQILSGFLNWENFKQSGRSGFELTLAYPTSLLGLFFGLSLIQIILLLVSKSFYKSVLILNFINSVLIFVAMIRLSSILGFQAASLASVAAVFGVLFNNVVGLIWINKDKNLLKKYKLL